MIVTCVRNDCVYYNAKFVDGNYYDRKDRLIGGNSSVTDIHFSEEELQEHIEAAVKEHDETANRTHFEILDLRSRIAELEAEQQKAEVSQDLADAIEWFSRVYSDIWEFHFVASNKIDCFELKEKNRSAYNEYFRQGRSRLLEIIKRGYTVKPDPLHIFRHLAGVRGRNNLSGRSAR